MENNIDIEFSKLFIPSKSHNFFIPFIQIVIDITECVIDLSYEDKKFRFKYPQKMPLTIPLTTSFHRDRQIISIIIMMTMGQKYKKIAKGEINIYKKYFQGDNVQTEKWVYLTLFQTQLENMGHNTDIIKAELNKDRKSVV